MSSPAVIIHGGAGSALDGGQREARIRASLEERLEKLWESAHQGAAAMDLVERGCAMLEDCRHFNAGRGSKLQRDGAIRMSAAIMEGARRAFSGIINVEWVQYPVKLAMRLQRESSRVLDGRGAELLAREMELPLFDAVEERRFSHWLEKTRKHRLGDVDAPEATGGGTVGVVVCDERGEVAAATSTGGRGFERVGRVSDTATVAGNYATDHGAVSCTGNGEDIIDEALAARIVVRMDTGDSLQMAVDDAIQGCEERGRSLAAIAVDARGGMHWAKTTEVLLAVGRNTDETKWAF